MTVCYMILTETTHTIVLRLALLADTDIQCYMILTETTHNIVLRLALLADDKG